MPLEVKRHGAAKLLVRIGALAVAILLSGFAIGQYDARAGDDNYLAAVLEKDRLIRNTPSPKIILVGGSNLAFGIDSRMMQDSLGLRVVNMGLYAKLGLKYMSGAAMLSSSFLNTISSMGISRTVTTRSTRRCCTRPPIV
jgi:hypothetical protein